MNKENKWIKNLRISSMVFRKISPYVLTTGIVVGSFQLVGAGLPFYRDVNYEYLHLKESFHENGLITVEKQYKEFSDERNLLYYYGDWEKGSEYYSRDVFLYSLKQYSKDDVLNLFRIEGLVLEDVLGKPISTFVEATNDITGKDSCFMAVMYDVSKDDYIVVKESVKDNLMETLLMLVGIIAGGMIPYGFDEYLTGFNLKRSIVQIKEEEEKKFTKK